MTINELIGYFTYRSFRNEVSGSPSDILWGEGELFLNITDEGTISGTLAFPAEPMAKNKDIMDINGAVKSWNPIKLRFIGKGRRGSSIEQFEYEYDCEAAHEWDFAAPKQKISLVGTVRRNKDHGQAKAGATASFIAVNREFVEPKDIDGVGLIPEAVLMLSERVHRLRHTVWHTLRQDWVSPNMTDDDRRKLGTLGWFLADPPVKADRSLDLTNGAGEDFLYMHRRMILMVHKVYDAAGKPRPASWTELPKPALPQFSYVEKTDPENPKLKFFEYDPSNSGLMVPPANSIFMEQVGGQLFFHFNKSSRGFNNLMFNMAQNLRNSRIVSQLTLGAYGNLIEFTVHNWMHMRWATVSRNPSTGEPEVRGDYDIDTKWDNPKNDYLGDFHSSHVNPIFWKLHGWVNDCVDFWYSVHQDIHPGQITKKDVRGIPWFAEGAWVKKADPFDWPGAGHEHHHEGHDELKTLEEVIGILKQISERPSLLESKWKTPLPSFAKLEALFSESKDFLKIF